MRVYDLMVGNLDLLRELKRLGLRVCDIDYLDAYAEVMALREQGNKMTWCVSEVSSSRAISERVLWYIVRRFSAEV